MWKERCIHEIFLGGTKTFQTSLFREITYFFYDNDGNDSRCKRPIQSFLGDFLDAIQSDGYVVCKHSIASEAFCMNQVTFALSVFAYF